MTPTTGCSGRSAARPGPEPQRQAAVGAMSRDGGDAFYIARGTSSERRFTAAELFVPISTGKLRTRDQIEVPGAIFSFPAVALSLKDVKRLGIHGCPAPFLGLVSERKRPGSGHRFFGAGTDSPSVCPEGEQQLVTELAVPSPNPRLRRTPSAAVRSPLGRKPLGGPANARANRKILPGSLFASVAGFGGGGTTSPRRTHKHSEGSFR